MLILLFQYVYIALTTLGVGLFCMHLTEKITSKSFISSRIDYAILLGLVGVISVLSVYSLFGGVSSIPAHGIVFIWSLGGFFMKKNILFSLQKNLDFNFRQDWFWVFLILLLWGGIINQALQQPNHHDSYMYHAQAIQWIEKYATPPGLGHIHSRFGFNPSIFIGDALYGFSFLGSKVYPLNSFLFLLFASTLIYTLRKNFIEKKYASSVVLSLVGMYYFFPVYKMLFPSLSSPTTDLPPAIYIFYIYLLFTEKIEKDNQNSNPTIFDSAFAVFLLFSSFLITLKLSAATIGILFFYFIFKKGFWASKSAWLVVLLAAMLLIPWIVRNAVITGYLVYPISALDVLNVDWKLSEQVVQIERDGIKGWAIEQGGDVPTLVKMSIKEWLPIWYSKQFLIYKVVIWGSILSPLFMLIGFLWKRNIKESYVYFWAMCLVSALIWFVSAPDVRFATGFLCFCAFLPITVLVESLPSKTWSMVIASFILLGFTMQEVYINLINPDYRPNPRFILSHIIAPAPMKEVKTEWTEAKNFKIKVVPSGISCGNAEVPCTSPQLTNLKDLMMRGEKIEDGFKMASQ